MFQTARLFHYISFKMYIYQTGKKYKQNISSIISMLFPYSVGKHDENKLNVYSMFFSCIHALQELIPAVLVSQTQYSNNRTLFGSHIEA